LIAKPSMPVLSFVDEPSSNADFILVSLSQLAEGSSGLLVLYENMVHNTKWQGESLPNKASPYKNANYLYVAETLTNENVAVQYIWAQDNGVRGRNIGLDRN
jgi:hypothetical protein